MYQDVGGMFSVAFQTLGCKVNQYETDALSDAFLRAGYIIKDESEKTDVFVINTCTVTAEADRKSRQMIRRARNKKPGTLVVAMGCQVEMSETGSEADLAVGTKCRGLIVKHVTDSLLGSKLPDTTEPYELAGFEELGPVTAQEDTRAHIKIQDGCDSFCSYCIIPFARGRVTSRKKEDVIAEATALASAGFIEVVITGIHVCSYGKDRGEGLSELCELIEQISEIDGIKRIRLGSLEPTALTEEFLLRLKGIPKLCPHFHVSLQSGSDSVLGRMNRHYDTAYFRKAAQTLRSHFSNASLTTDVIVGFPGETEEEHCESLHFCEEMQFSKIHVFPFSERKGTKAALMKPKVPPDVRAGRCSEFLRLSDQMSARFHESFIGSNQEVLVEKIDEDGECEGYSSQYIRIRGHKNPAWKKNALQTVQVVSATKDGVYAEIADVK
jgi:threonylcarbamoyladenosine tRNA methylthiotransferase MtaB